MATKFLTYDKAGLARPQGVADRLLQAKDDSAHSLAVTDCYDLEDGEEEQFEEALAAVNREFDGVLARLTAALGEPAYTGTDKDKKFPSWAGTGYRVAYWKSGKRIVYLHITHVGSVAPVELTLGVVTGPPKNWAVGTE
jgi:hypothetical protein